MCLLVLLSIHKFIFIFQCVIVKLTALKILETNVKSGWSYPSTNYKEFLNKQSEKNF